MRIFEPILNAQFLTFFCVKKFFQKDDISKNYLTGIFLTILFESKSYLNHSHDPLTEFDLHIRQFDRNTKARVRASHAYSRQHYNNQWWLFVTEWCNTYRYHRPIVYFFLFFEFMLYLHCGYKLLPTVFLVMKGNFLHQF